MRIPYQIERTFFNEKIKGITCYEEFKEVEDIQYFNNIKIEMGLPYTEIKFKKEDTKIALQVLALKTLAGFNIPEDHYNFFINNSSIDKKDLNLEEEDIFNFIDSFTEKYKSILKNENSIKVEFVDDSNYEYVRSIIINTNFI